MTTPLNMAHGHKGEEETSTDQIDPTDEGDESDNQAGPTGARDGSGNQAGPNGDGPGHRIATSSVAKQDSNQGSEAKPHESHGNETEQGAHKVNEATQDTNQENSAELDDNQGNGAEKQTNQKKQTEPDENQNEKAEQSANLGDEDERPPRPLTPIVISKSRHYVIPTAEDHAFDMKSALAQLCNDGAGPSGYIAANTSQPGNRASGANQRHEAERLTSLSLESLPPSSSPSTAYDFILCPFQVGSCSCCPSLCSQPTDPIKDHLVQHDTYNYFEIANFKFPLSFSIANGLFQRGRLSAPDFPETSETSEEVIDMRRNNPDELEGTVRERLAARRAREERRNNCARGRGMCFASAVLVMVVCAISAFFIIDFGKDPKPPK